MGDTTVRMRPGRFNSYDVVIGAAAQMGAVAEAVDEALLAAAGKGAVYIWLPLVDVEGVAKGVPTGVKWMPHVQTEKYNILVHDPTGTVPPAASAIEGAHVLPVVRGRDGFRVLMARKQDQSRWCAFGGSLNRGEGAIEGAIRELAEELGIDRDAAEALALRPHDGTGLGLFAAGSTQTKAARTYGVFDEGDPPVVANDSCHFYYLFVESEGAIDALRGGAPADDAEIAERVWFDVDAVGKPVGADGTAVDTFGTVGRILYGLEHGTRVPARVSAGAGRVSEHFVG